MIAIIKSLWKEIDYIMHNTFKTTEEYKRELKKMCTYNQSCFNEYPKMVLEENISEKKIKVNWRQRYDIECLFEPAIVKVLTNRSQKGIFKTNNKSKQL